MPVTFLHTPTFEVDADEAFRAYQRYSKTTTHYGLSAKGRGGKPALRVSTTKGLGIELGNPAEHGRTADKPFRMSFDVQFDRLPEANAFRKLLTFSTPYHPTDEDVQDNSVYLYPNGSFQVRGWAVFSPASEVLFPLGRPVTVEIELMARKVGGYIKVWLDGMPAIDFVGEFAFNDSGYNGIDGIKLNHTVDATDGTGTHYSNILIHNDTTNLGVANGPLDFAYVPVTEAALSETTTNDASSTITFSDSAFREFTLAADDRPGEVLAYAPVVRAATFETSPGLLDIKVGKSTMATKVSVPTVFENIRLKGNFGALPDNTLSIRNAAATS